MLSSFGQFAYVQILEERLRARKTECEESLQKRLAAAKEELDYGTYNYVGNVFI